MARRVRSRRSGGFSSGKRFSAFQKKIPMRPLPRTHYPQRPRSWVFRPPLSRVSTAIRYSPRSQLRSTPAKFRAVGKVSRTPSLRTVDRCRRKRYKQSMLEKIAAQMAGRGSGALKQWRKQLTRSSNPVRC